MVAAKVFGRVLPLPVRVVGRWAAYCGAGGDRLLMVRIHVLDAHEDGMPSPTVGATAGELGHDDGAVPVHELCPVVSDA